MKKHEIKVQEQHTPTTTYGTRAARRAPKLTMVGKWLEQAGFIAGTTAEIEVSAGVLVIRVKQTTRVEEPRPIMKATKRAPWADVREELTQAFH